MNSHDTILRRWFLGLLVFVLATVSCLLRWGGDLLIASDPLPAHLDVAVSLQGSLSGESVRVPAAMELLRRGIARHVLLSVPSGTVWGEPIPPLVRRYLEENYGREIGDQVQFCETGSEVNSTVQESRVLAQCIQNRAWHSVAVVTSSYHSRRAGIIWRRTLNRKTPSVHVWVDGVEDPDFKPQGWWRHRTYAKTWFLETTKLLWTSIAPGF